MRLGQRWALGVVVLVGILGELACGGNGDTTNLLDARDVSDVGSTGDASVPWPAEVSVVPGEDAGGGPAVDGSIEVGRACVPACAADAVCQVTTGTCVPCAGGAGCATSDAGWDGVPSDVVDGGPSTSGCVSSLDCRSTSTTPICQPATGRCVQCVRKEDCATSHDCVQNACVPYTSCTSSLDCGGKVCDLVQGRCVQCMVRTDCPDSMDCFANSCHQACNSDGQCVSSGQLCNLTTGVCVACLAHEHCPTHQYCSQGKCLPDNCDAGSARCLDDRTVATCDSDGAFVEQTTCQGDTRCSQTGTTASCRALTCPPGTRTCAGNGVEVLECLPDGSAQAVKVSCAASGQVCVDGDCVTGTCVPNSFSCASNTLLRCAANGASWSTAASCLLDQYCDAEAGTCKAQACTPRQSICRNNAIMTCNDTGSEFVGPGVDCGATRVCLKAACFDAWFEDDFEGDPRTAGWTIGNPRVYTRSRISPGANGTATALVLDGNSIGIANTGLYKKFDSPVRPRIISFWWRLFEGSPTMMFTADPAGGVLRQSIAIGSWHTTLTRNAPFYLDLLDGTNIWQVSPTDWIHIQIELDWTALRYQIIATTGVLGSEKLLGTVSNRPIPDAIGRSGILRMDMYASGHDTGRISHLDEVELLP